MLAVTNESRDDDRVSGDRRTSSNASKKDGDDLRATAKHATAGSPVPSQDFLESKSEVH